MLRASIKAKVVHEPDVIPNLMEVVAKVRRWALTNHDMFRLLADISGSILACPTVETQIGSARMLRLMKQRSKALLKWSLTQRAKRRKEIQTEALLFIEEVLVLREDAFDNMLLRALLTQRERLAFLLVLLYKYSNDSTPSSRLQKRFFGLIDAKPALLRTLNLKGCMLDPDTVVPFIARVSLTSSPPSPTHTPVLAGIKLGGLSRSTWLYWRK